MYAYIKGTIEEIYEDHCVVEAYGIGYNIYISPMTASKLPAIGDVVKIYTYTNVREDAFLLYGFLTRSELELYKLCISVSGIGPKGGLSLLSAMNPEDLRFAIASQDIKTISSAPGIGKKTAERLILELKGKIDYDDSMFTREMGAEAGVATSVGLAGNAVMKEAIDALVALGYDATSASKAVHAVENAQDMDAGVLLKMALKHLF